MSEAKQEIGVKESKEALVGVFNLALLLTERLKDGIGVDDVMLIFGKLTSDAEFKKSMEDAFKGVKEIPAEVKDLSLDEGMELLSVPIAYVPKFIALFQKSEG